MIELVVFWKADNETFQQSFDNLLSISEHLRLLIDNGFPYDITLKEKPFNNSNNIEGF